MRNVCFVFIVILSVLLLNFTPVSSVFAQDEDTFTLEEITVTADKREENVQKVPLSVSVVSAEEIKDKSYKSIDDMLQNIPGLQVQGAGSDAKIFIRGIGLNNLDTAYGDPAIALNVDGIQQQRGNALSNSTMDIERIEVLRGPQGTMYGRNATGGAVNIIMAKPKDKVEIQARAQFGNYDARTYEAVLNVPVYSKLALRASGVKDERDTYMSGPGADGFEDQTTARVKALFTPSDDFSLMGTVEYREDKSSGGWASVPASNLDASDPWYMEEASSGGAASMYSNQWSESWSYSLNLDWTIQDLAKLSLIPAATTNDLHAEASGNAPPQPYPSATQYTYEARLANLEDSSFDWTVGGFLWDSSTSNEEAELSTTPGWNLMQGDRPTGSWALFGQATYPVFDNLRVVGGLRYSSDNKEQEYRIYYNNDDGEKIFDSGIVSYGDKLSKPTYKLGVEYDLAESSMAYLTASSGYKSGGITFAYDMFVTEPTGEDYQLPADMSPYQYDEETSMSYELGFKNRLMNNRLQLNGALFMTAYEGLQVMMWKKINEDDDPTLLIRNAGETYTWGAEIESTWQVTSTDRLNVAVSTMHGKYKDIVIEYDSPSWAGGADNPPVDLDGIDMANMPEFNLQLGYTHTFDLFSYGSLSTTFDTNYKTKYYNNIEVTNDGSLVPDHHISNFYMNWSSPSGTYSASANVKNIENKAIAVMASSREVSLNSPRTYTASFSVRW